MENEAGLGGDVRGWIQREADERYGGDWAAAAADILEAAYEAARRPEDRWAHLQTWSCRRPARPRRVSDPSR